MKYRAVLFDLDGTLLDTLADLADSMNGVLTSFGLPSHDEEVYKYFIGDGMQTLVRRSLPRSYQQDEETVARCLEAMREAYGVRWKEKSKPYDGIPELLDSLTTRRMKMAILSNKPDDFAKLMATELLSQWEFAIIAGERPSVPKKPDPTAAIQIAEHLRIPHAEFLYLGDTGIDMRTADAAGMYAVGVLWGFRKAEELSANGARILLERPLDLLKLL